MLFPIRAITRQVSSRLSADRWGVALYENRTKNLSEIKNRMWYIMQWGVAFNLGAVASITQPNLDSYLKIIGVGAVITSIVCSLFIANLHIGLFKHRCILEDMKGRFGSHFLRLHGPLIDGRKSRWNDWQFGSFQIALIAATGASAALICFKTALDGFSATAVLIPVVEMAVTVCSILVLLGTVEANSVRG